MRKPSLCWRFMSWYQKVRHVFNIHWALLPNSNSNNFHRAEVSFDGTYTVPLTSHFIKYHTRCSLLFVPSLSIKSRVWNKIFLPWFWIYSNLSAQHHSLWNWVAFSSKFYSEFYIICCSTLAPKIWSFNFCFRFVFLKILMSMLQATAQFQLHSGLYFINWASFYQPCWEFYNFHIRELTTSTAHFPQLSWEFYLFFLFLSSQRATAHFSEFSSTSQQL